MSTEENDASTKGSQTTEDAPAQEAGPAGSPAPAGPDPAIAALTAERDRYKDGLLRAMADLDNVRKRTRREVDDARAKARGDILLELLPVFDNLERAMQHSATAKDTSAIVKGLEMVVRLFEDSLGRINGKRLKSLGAPFDPAVHEAIQQIESDEHPAGVVAREELAGYVLDGKLLRPSMVVVSRGPGPASVAAVDDGATGAAPEDGSDAARVEAEDAGAN